MHTEGGPKKLHWFYKKYITTFLISCHVCGVHQFEDSCMQCAICQVNCLSWHDTRCNMYEFLFQVATHYTGQEIRGSAIESYILIDDTINIWSGQGLSSCDGPRDWMWS
jgi:hypothetical protein